MLVAEGTRVSYIGYGSRDGLEMGDQGKVLSASATASHVKWATGKQSGQIILVANDDITPRGSARHELDDSITEGSLVSFAVRTVYEEAGPTGLLNTLNAEGHLSCFQHIAEEALRSIGASVRNTPAVQRVIAFLDNDEADEFVAVATAALVRDAFGPEGD